MPRYYFHLRDDGSVDDPEGSEHRDLPAARAEAVKDALSMIAASVLEQARINLSHRIEVADESGRILTTVAFGDAVAIEG